MQKTYELYQKSHIPSKCHFITVINELKENGNNNKKTNKVTR